jgi:hypothetical protein
MKLIGLTLATLTIVGVMAGSTTARAENGVLLKEEAAGGTYCHMKFPAIEESTLYTDHPVLKSADSGDIIDFYGPCDENPLGKDQVASQRSEHDDESNRAQKWGSGL